MTDDLQALIEHKDTLLKWGISRLWAWAEEYVEQLIATGERLSESEHPVKLGRELGLSDRVIRRARILSSNPDRAREAFQRCLVRAMRAGDAISIESVVNEHHRLSWKSGIGLR